MGRIPCQDLGSRHSGSCIARRRKEGLLEDPVSGRGPLRVSGSTLPGLLGGAPELTGQCALKHFPVATWGVSSPGQYHFLHSDAWAMHGAQGAGRRQSRERTGGRGAGRWTHRDTWEHMNTFRKLDTRTHVQAHKPHPESHTKPQGSDTRSYANTKCISLTVAADTPKHAQPWGPRLAPAAAVRERILGWRLALDATNQEA